ncbi:DUF2790 domain-containing protein [Denitrificimonas caeni]|uniref:DUF2790 domain-containing protein n=1 Tax=Denitrificimonas caeni TaxID=521720 RepID=UPI0019645556|nr:DUF2790 domain-containing protein [Denitrificimonas caeni]
MNIIKVALTVALLSSTQLAFSKSSVEQVSQKHQEQTIDVTRKYALDNNKKEPVIVDYKYGMKIDVAKLIHQTKDVEVCGNYKKIMSYEDAQGELHSVRYTLLGDCRSSRG